MWDLILSFFLFIKKFCDEAALVGTRSRAISCQGYNAFLLHFLAKKHTLSPIYIFIFRFILTLVLKRSEDAAWQKGRKALSQSPPSQSTSVMGLCRVQTKTLCH